MNRKKETETSEYKRAFAKFHSSLQSPLLGEMPHEEIMLRWQYFMLINDWKRLARVIASIAALLQTAIDAIWAKSDEEREHPAYKECLKVLEDILAGNKDNTGDITDAYKNLIGGEKGFGQYCLAAMRKENMRLESEIVGLKAHVEALEKELGGRENADNWSGK